MYISLIKGNDKMSQVLILKTAKYSYFDDRVMKVPSCYICGCFIHFSFLICVRYHLPSLVTHSWCFPHSRSKKLSQWRWM